MNLPEFSNPAYRIETKRLVVRCYNPSDASLLAESVIESLEHLRPWMPWVYNEPEPLEEKAGRLKRFRGLFDLGQDFVYGIFDPQETKLIGGNGLHTRLGDSELEIGYWIHRDYVNQGLVTETTAALVRVAFELIHIHRLEIHCDPGNAASAAVPHSPSSRAEIKAFDANG